MPAKLPPGERERRVKAARKDRWAKHKKELSIKNKVWRENNADKVAAGKKEYALKNQDKIKKYRKKRWADNKEELAKKYFEWCQSHKEHLREYKKQYNQNNADRLKKAKKISSKAYRNYVKSDPLLLEKRRKADRDQKRKIRAEKKPEMNAYQRAYLQKRRKDPEFKLIENCRRRIHHALSGRAKKSDHTSELIGCSPSELKKHLEKQFESWMTWRNYGKKGWVIDHIKAVMQFDLTDPDQQKLCFHWSNMRPIHWMHNTVKNQHEDSPEIEARWKELADFH